MKISKKVRFVGTSLGILLPDEFIKFKELKEGDFIEIDSKHIKKVNNNMKGGKRKNG